METTHSLAQLPKKINNHLVTQKQIGDSLPFWPLELITTYAGKSSPTKCQQTGDNLAERKEIPSSVTLTETITPSVCTISLLVVGSKVASLSSYPARDMRLGSDYLMIRYLLKDTVNRARFVKTGSGPSGRALFVVAVSSGYSLRTLPGVSAVAFTRATGSPSPLPG